MFHGISAFRLFWQRLLARLRYCGGAHYLAGAPSLPPPLTPEQEKPCWPVWQRETPAPGTT